MGKKIIFLWAVVILSVCEGSISFSQETKKQFIHKGLLRAMATISPGMMLKENTSTILLHGNLEYYIDDNISLRGDSYYFLQANNNSGTNPFEFNHSIFSGASYHLKTKSHFDPSISLEPGISISKTKAVNVDCDIPPCPPSYPAGNVTANPLISSAIGFNLYFERWFHLFMETRYVYGKHVSIVGGPTISLSELRFSFGLGFNLSVFKPK